MPRRREVPKRVILPDPKFGSEVLAQFMNVLMKDGKKSTAEKVVYGALDQLAQRMSRKASNEVDDDSEGGSSSGGRGPITPLDLFIQSLANVRPSVEVRSRRVGGATYQVPMEVPHARQVALAMRWIVSYAQARKNVPLMEALAAELKDAAAGQGNAIKKRDDTHKMAQANRAFAHFRW